jgi:cytochrome c
VRAAQYANFDHNRQTMSPPNDAAAMINLARLLLLTSMPIFGAFAIAQAAIAQEGSAKRGASLFRMHCAACHINQGGGGRGPNLTDIVGGKPSVPGFKYSSSIRIYSWRWDAERLDRYLTNPRSVVRGASMASRVHNAKDRADIIAYLKTLRSPEGTPKMR